MKTTTPSRILLAALSALALALLPTSLHAQTDYFWSGNSNTNFFDSANWVGGVTPPNSLASRVNFTAASYSNQPSWNQGWNLNGFVFGDGTNASGAVTLTASSQFVLLNYGGIVMNPNAGAVTVNGVNFLRITANQTWTNNSASAFTNNGNIIAGSAGNTLTFAGTGIFNPGTLNQITGTVNYAVSMTGNGTVNIGQSDSSGTITLNSGRLGIGSPISLGASGLGNLVINGGTLQAATIDRTITNTNAIAINGSFTYGSAAENGRILNLGNGAVTLGANATISTYGNGTLQLAGAIGDGGSGRGITKADTGTLTLNGTNTFSGSTTVSAGTLVVANALALQNSALDTTASVTGNATAGLKTTVTTLTLGGLNGNKDLANVFTTTSGGYGSVTALTVNPGTGVTSTYTGNLTNGASGMTLTKTGNGTQILSGTNTYTGATLVTTGTLVVNGSLATSSITVQSGATLGGNITATGGLTTIQNGATLSVGNSPGTGTFASLTLNGTTAMEINGPTGPGTNYDTIIVNGTNNLTLGGNLTFTFGASLSNNSTLDLFNFTGKTGNFANVTSTGSGYNGTWTKSGETWTYNTGPQLLTFSQLTGDLTVVPEPATWALLAFSLTTVIVLRRRRNS